VRRRGSAIGLAAGVSVVLLTAGCGFLGALANPEAADTEHPTATASATATPGPPVPLTIVEGDLLTRGGAPAGHLSVSVGKIQTGLVPPVPVADFDEACAVEGSSLQYVPVDFAFTSAGLAAHVTIGRGPATPADAGQVGIFVESGNSSQVYCADAPPLPTADKFWNQMGAPTITAWVVVDRAVTPETPDGRPEVFPTLQLRISDFRRFTDPTAQQTLMLGPLGLGAPCADDAEAICVPLG
jgi:hypothetical protein